MTMNEVQAIRPALGIGELLVGAHFADAYRVAVAVAELDATSAAMTMIDHPSSCSPGTKRAGLRS